MRRNSHDASLGLFFFKLFSAALVQEEPGSIHRVKTTPSCGQFLLPDNGFLSRPIPCSLEKSSHVGKLANASFAALFKLVSFAFAAELNVSALGTFPHGAWSDLCSFCPHSFSLLSCCL